MKDFPEPVSLRQKGMLGKDLKIAHAVMATHGCKSGGKIVGTSTRKKFAPDWLSCRAGSNLREVPERAGRGRARVPALPHGRRVGGMTHPGFCRQRRAGGAGASWARPGACAGTAAWTMC